ncbi:thioredoxin domain-containing protein [bacterium]|nr:thioredoxin domain-containing protein [bacterium]
MDSSKITNRYAILAILSTLAAFGVHLYLTQQHFLTKYTMADASPLCNINSFLNCSSSIVSPFSEFLGTPLSIFGMVTQALLLFFLMKNFLSEESEEKNKALSTALFGALFSFVASLVMAAISIFFVHSLCPFCTGAYVLSALTLFAVWKLKQKSKTSFLTQIPFKYLLISTLVLGLGGWAMGQVSLRKYKDRDFEQMTQLRIQNWLSQDEKKMELVAPQKWGPDDAKMKIVEFADFLCSHCKVAFPKLHTFAKQGDVQILFQTWPLDGCSGTPENPGRRCELAKISYCANQQDKGNEAQEYLFAMQEIFAELSDLKTELEIMYGKLALNNEKMDACLKNSKTLEDIKAQIELGKTLGIQGTPALFINNKLFQGGPHIPTLQEVYKKIQSGH